MILAPLTFSILWGASSGLTFFHARGWEVAENEEPKLTICKPFHLCSRVELLVLKMELTPLFSKVGLPVVNKSERLSEGASAVSRQQGFENLAALLQT